MLNISGYALFIFYLLINIHYHLCTIGKVQIAGGYDNITFLNSCLFTLTARDGKGTDVGMYHIDVGPNCPPLFQKEDDLIAVPLHDCIFGSSWALHLLGHLAHGAVNFLVHLYEEKVYVAARLKGHPDTAGIYSRLGTDVGYACHLHQTTSERRYDIPLHFLGRESWHIRLYSYLWYINVGHQRDGDVMQCQAPHHHDGDETHGHGYRTEKKLLCHIIYNFFHLNEIHRLILYIIL